MNAYLLSLRCAHRQQTSRASSPSMMLSYLLTAWHEDPRQAHEWIGRLILAAIDHREFELEGDPPPLELWQTLGIRPRPTEAFAPLVTQPLELRQNSVRNLTGFVFGPGRIPVYRAVVRIESLGKQARTDEHGRFEFFSVPTDLQFSVQVSAKGDSVTKELNGDAALSIQLDFSEDKIEG